MPDEAQVLDYLREQFSRLHLRLDALERWTEEAMRRFVSIERQIAGLRRDAAHDAETVVELKENVAILAGRIQHIERRLDIVD